MVGIAKAWFHGGLGSLVKQYGPGLEYDAGMTWVQGARWTWAYTYQIWMGLSSK